MKLRRLLLPVASVAFAAAALLGSAPQAHATIVERVVAVVGERPILWTELLHRAVASRVQIRMQARDPNVVSVQEQEMYKELLDRMIDDRLEEQQADKARIHVTSEQIDRGIASIAAQAQAQQGRPVTVADVLGEVRRRGLTEADFREEIRRQVLEGQLIELRVRPRVRVTDMDARATYQHWAKDMQSEQPVDVRILVLRVMPDWTQEQRQARMVLAQTLASKAQANPGEFCDLVTQYSDDVSTRSSCGSHGPQPFATLLPQLQQVVQTVKPGAVSDPMPMRVGADEVIVIAMPLGETKVPGYDAVKDQMMQRATLEGIERARKQWLEELRHNIYIDVRL